MFNAGDRVRLVIGDDAEKAMSYRVVEWNGDRGFIEPLGWSGRIVPQELVRAGDITLDHADHPGGGGSCRKGDQAKIGEGVGPIGRGEVVTILDGPHRVNGVQNVFLVLDRYGNREMVHESRLKPV